MNPMKLMKQMQQMQERLQQEIADISVSATAGGGMVKVDMDGQKALRSVGRYLKRHDATVTAIYTSNVEQYLFQGDGWRRFFGNVSALPVDPGATFIRAYFNNMGYRYQMTSGARSATLLDPIAEEVAAFSEGRIQSYYDIIERSHGVR